MTNAITVAAELGHKPGIRVFCAGGEVRPSSLETSGPSAEAFFCDHDLDIAFLGADGVDAEAGCTNYEPAGARVNTTLVARSKMRVILADSSKIGRVTMAPLCPISAVDVLVTDHGAPEARVQALRDTGRIVTLV